MDTPSSPTEATPNSENVTLKPSSFRARIETCKNYRRKLIPQWITSIDYRRAKPFASQTDEDRIIVPLDWPLTKSKEAGLFSRVPQVRVDHGTDTFAPGMEWVHEYESKLNDTLVSAGIETVMEEVLPDCINAAGFGAAIVSYEVLTDMAELPTVDPATLGPGEQPDPSAMTTLPRVTDKRYLISRISPADFLWPTSFTGADFNKAPWIGRSGRTTWAQAQQLFKLKPEDKESVVGQSRTFLDRLTHDLDKDREKSQSDDIVEFDEIFYKVFEFDNTCKKYGAIQRLVFVTGKEEPVVNEPWNGQRTGPDGTITGSSKFPIQILTLTYITDEAIPPSDSAIGRSQVNELNKSRTQMIIQRDRNLPIRAFNNDRVDPLISQALMRGVQQAAIPVQGQPEGIFAEVARSSIPPENFTFDETAKRDLDNFWQIGVNQQGAFAGSRTSAAEAGIVQSNTSTRISKERAKIVKYVTAISEVLGGLLAIYEDPTTFGQGFDPAIAATLSYSILADSTVIVDTQTRRETLKDFINFTAKSGFVDVQTVLKEYATLSSLDPNTVIVPPQPKPPVEPTITIRFTGAADIMNPLVLAFLMKSGQAPSGDLIEQAKQLIQLAMMSPASGPPLPPPEGGAPQVGVPVGSPMPGAPPIGPNTLPPPPMPPPPQPFRVGDAHPRWAALDRINKRVMDKE